MSAGELVAIVVLAACWCAWATRLDRQQHHTTPTATPPARIRVRTTHLYDWEAEG